MAKQVINIGSYPDDPGADTARAALEKAKGNFDELYAKDLDLENQITAASKGIKPFETEALMNAFTPGDGDPADNREIAKVWNDPDPSKNGYYNWDGDSWEFDAPLTEEKEVIQWASTGAYFKSNITLSANNNLATADLLWPDGVSGSISDLVEDSEGRLESLRYNWMSGKYVTLTVDYSGDYPEITPTTTGF